MSPVVNQYGTNDAATKTVISDLRGTVGEMYGQTWWRFRDVFTWPLLLLNLVTLDCDGTVAILAFCQTLCATHLCCLGDSDQIHCLVALPN